VEEGTGNGDGCSITDEGGCTSAGDELNGKPARSNSTAANPVTAQPAKNAVVSLMVLIILLRLNYGNET